MKIQDKKQFESLPSGTRLFIDPQTTGMLAVMGAGRALFMANKEIVFTIETLEDGIVFRKTIEGFHFKSELVEWSEISVISDRN